MTLFQKQKHIQRKVSRSEPGSSEEYQWGLCCAVLHNILNPGRRYTDITCAYRVKFLLSRMLEGAAKRVAIQTILTNTKPQWREGASLDF